MLIVPGLSESLGAVGKRIIHFDTTDARLSVEAASSVRWARCPRCSHSSSRRHGLYRRHLRAQPCMGRSVNLSVQVRRYKCVNRQCSRTTFVERIEDLAQPKQRRTIGLSGEWCAMAQALGGSAAARFSVKARDRPGEQSGPGVSRIDSPSRCRWLRPLVGACGTVKLPRFGALLTASRRIYRR